MVRSWRGWFGLAVAFLAGCKGTPVCQEDVSYTDGSASLHGTVLDVSGAPVSGASLSLTRSYTFDLFHPTNDFERTATTTADGSFHFGLLQDEMRNGLGVNLQFFLTSPQAPGVNMRFYIHEPKVQLPALRPYESDVADVASDASGLHLSWPALGGESVSTTYAVALLAGDEGSIPPIWRTATPDTTFSLRPGLLEDFETAGWSVDPEATACGSGSIFALNYVPVVDSLTTPLPGGPLPLSRGVPCSADVALQSGSTCPVTDGLLDYLSFGSAFLGRPQFVTVDLGTTQQLGRVVLRELNPFGSNPDADGKRPDHELEILVSDDGQTFSRVMGPLALQPNENGCYDKDTLVNCYMDLQLPVGTSGRFVRAGLVQGIAPTASGDNLATISELVEFSVFAP